MAKGKCGVEILFHLKKKLTFFKVKKVNLEIWTLLWLLPHLWFNAVYEGKFWEVRIIAVSVISASFGSWSMAMLIESLRVWLHQESSLPQSLVLSIAVISFQSTVCCSYSTFWASYIKRKLFLTFCKQQYQIMLQSLLKYSSVPKREI